MKNNKINRRNFFKTAGYAGMGGALGYFGLKNDHSEAGEPSKSVEYPHIPKRRLGKTGEMVPVLSHGIMYDLLENQIVLRKALQLGISHWDTSHAYAGGNSELGIGKFLKRFPEKRKDLFIVSKASKASTVDEVEERLQTSFKRMNTDYIDLYYGVHACSDPSQLTPELKKWAADAKKRKVIKHFGFSTHKNMAKCLMAASKMDWIDVIMTSWNFRLMQDPEMEKAVDACHNANIGLIAMKVMGLPINSDGDKKLTDHFIKKGFSDGQAKLKAVLNDKRFAAACVTMESTALLAANAAAVLDKVSFSKNDMDVFRNYAFSSCSGYCAGCADICDAAMPDTPVISDVLRYLMYYNSYGMEKKARDLFTEIPAGMRRRLLSGNYEKAESQCPQNLPIGDLIKEAVEKLA